MVAVVLQTEDGQRLELQISEPDHVSWQVGTGEKENDEKGYCEWSALDNDLAEGISSVSKKLVEAVQLWRDNYMLTSLGDNHAYAD
jgi:hypothetical protein